MENIFTKCFKLLLLVIMATLITVQTRAYCGSDIKISPGENEIKPDTEIVYNLEDSNILLLNSTDSTGTFDFTSEKTQIEQSDTIKGTPDEKIVKSNSDPENKFDQIKSIDSTRFDMFGNLLDDDTLYVKKYPLWRPLTEVLELHIALGLINRYVSNADFGRVGFNTWSSNIKNGWEWDTDRFGMNFLGHPYSGGLNFMSARSNGYNFWESAPFAITGSLLWEYFGENTKPSYNDIINTPVSGVFYGEILYRLASNILDDRTTGSERLLREIGAAALSPTRFFNRLINGDLTRVTSEEIYQKAPLNIELSGGIRKLNTGHSFNTGPQNAMFNVRLDYGYPLEKRTWKPFDYFKVDAGVNLGVGRKIIESITGYGVLFGKTVQSGNLEMMTGIFQHYNYFDNTTFELGTIAFGPGIMSKLSVYRESYLFTNLHIGIVPLAGNSTRFGPDTSQVRDYNYAGGMEGKLECGLNVNWASIQLIGYYYWLYTYVGATGNNFIGILKPRVTVRLYKNLNIGFEQLVYYTDRYTPSLGNFHGVRSEQRLYLMLNVGNFKL
jgi:hypothetical protein